MKAYRFVFGILLIILLGCCLVKQETKYKILEGKKYYLVWQDEFSKDGMPDPNNWTYDIGGHGFGNNELQYYTNARYENVHIKDGKLKIIAQKEDYTKDGQTWQYTSTRLVSKDLADFKYGYFEIKARLPYGIGSWPAIWMLPTDYEYGPWPSSGEIDIMEHVGKDPGVVVGSIHTESYNHKIKTQKNASIKVDDPFLEFHRYGMRWTAETIEIYLDDVKYFTFKNEHTGYRTWPFDKPFHLLFNIAIGGSWGGPDIDTTRFPMAMNVDYVRVYQID